MDIKASMNDSMNEYETEIIAPVQTDILFELNAFWTSCASGRMKPHPRSNLDAG